jgi:hypothetical protein
MEASAVLHKGKMSKGRTYYIYETAEQEGTHLIVSAYVPVAQATQETLTVTLDLPAPAKAPKANGASKATAAAITPELLAQALAMLSQPAK